MSKTSFAVSIILSMSIMFATLPVEAAKKRSLQKKIPQPIQTSLVVDGKSGKILHSRNAKSKIYPASLTKVMTIYLIFEALDSGKLRLNQSFYVSKYATEALPSKLYLKHKERITVRDTILALTVKSANDAARVAAENIAGSEAKFARLMTIRAKQLGMTNTNFTNASGWHDPKQYTTAVDMAKLTIAIKRDFPKYYSFFNKSSFNFKGKTIKGHNKVTETYPGAEGLKTGFHTPAGCNLITTATRGNKSLVGVVTGQKTSLIRDKKMVKLLDAHFGVRHKSIKKVSKAKNLKISSSAVKSRQTAKKRR
ncbi:MAG: D-alanyl-D-alanine carboxypeptidase [Rickettsiaceae bacterium]|nr:D-alanyl-D-alanine carboxypeptidase [Rickettsiaceae bacterium]